jgi:hypothetical protein
MPARAALYTGDKTHGYRHASLNTMTIVLAPLDYRRSPETVKTIVERFYRSFEAGFQSLPKYRESGKAEDTQIQPQP